MRELQRRGKNLLGRWGHTQTWLLAVICSVLLLHRGYFRSGDLTWNDWGWLSPQTMQFYFHLPAIWDPTVGTGSVNVNIGVAPLMALFGLLSHVGFSYGAAERVLVFFPITLLPALSMFWLLGMFTKHPGARATGALVFAANTYLQVIQLQHLFITLAYSVTPITVGVLLRSLNQSRRDNPSTASAVYGGIGFGLAFALVLLFDARVAILVLVPCIILTVASVATGGSIRHASIAVGTGLVVVALVHSYWILPTMLGGTSSAFAAVLPATPFASFYSLKHSAFLTDPFYNGMEPVWFQVHPVTLYAIGIPLLSLIGAMSLFRSRDWRLPALASIALAGVFLAKGANSPLGDSYDWAFAHVPGMRFFRDSSKFMLWVCLSYSILIAAATTSAARWLNGTDSRGRPIYVVNQLSILPQHLPTKVRYALNNSRIRRQVLAMVLLASLVISMGFGARASVDQSIGGTLRPVSVDPVYQRFIQILNEDKRFSRVLWLPYVSRFGSRSTTHPVTSLDDVTKIASALHGSTTTSNGTGPPEVTVEQLADAVQFLGVGYVAVPHQDSSETLISPAQTQLVERILIADKALTPVIETPSLEVLRVNRPTTGVEILPTNEAEPLAITGTSNVGSFSESATTSHVVINQPPPGASTLYVSSAFDEGWHGRFFTTDDSGHRAQIPAIHTDSALGTNAYVMHIPPHSHLLTGDLNYGPQRLADAGFFVGLTTLVCGSFALILNHRHLGIQRARAD